MFTLIMPNVNNFMNKVNKGDSKINGDTESIPVTELVDVLLTDREKVPGID